MPNRDQMRGPMSLDDYSKLRGQDLSQIAVELPADPRQPPPASPPPNVDWGFIGDRESLRLGGYMVLGNDKEVMDQSGVTIATGFDLGQHNEDDLKALNLSPELVAKLKPYLLLTREKARSYLQKNPLTITEEEARTIDQGLKERTYRKTARSYNNAAARNYGAKKAPRFEDLPREAQTAIISTAYQYGNLAIKAPNYWRQITNGDWQGAYGNLMAFGDKYDPRRKLEAGKLKEAIDGGRLPGAPPLQKQVR